MSIFRIILTLVEALLALNLMIFVHELGHFLAAKWRGLKIDRFAIWFGKPVWKKRVGGVEYALGWIPAGGYVALPQMATMEAIEGKSETSGEPLPNISALDKIIVAFAGPLFSFLLAVGIAFGVWGVGRPVSRTNLDTTIGYADKEGPAWKAGLRSGDKILEVDGHPVDHFASMSQNSITWRIISSEGTNIPIKYLREGKEYMAYPTPYIATNKWYERRALRKIMIAPARQLIIQGLATNSPAELGGLKPEDEIIKLNGKRIFSYIPILDAEDAFTNADSAPLNLTVLRDGKEMDFALRPVKPVQPEDVPPSLGILSLATAGDIQIVHPNPWIQVRDSMLQILSTIRTVSSRKSDIGVQQLGGPVMIIRVYKNLFEDEQGWRKVLWFSVVLNVNLALLNLLPLPVLDGGHITLALVEAVRRRAVSPKFLLYVQNGFAALLIMFMIYIAFFDTGDWVRSARNHRDQPPVFAPPK